MQRLSIQQFRESEKLPLVVVLDDVRSSYNVGSVFRTCDAFRVQTVCLCGITATPPSAEIHKTALGAEDSVAWQYFDTAHAAVLSLREKGYQILAVEQAEGSTQLQSLGEKLQEGTSQERAAAGSLLPPCAIVLGNEVKGVHQSVVDLCDGCLEIPQFGTKHSLNVSVAAGIVIWEFAHRQLLRKEK